MNQYNSKSYTGLSNAHPLPQHCPNRQRKYAWKKKSSPLKRSVKNGEEKPALAPHIQSHDSHHVNAALFCHAPHLNAPCALLFGKMGDIDRAFRPSSRCVSSMLPGQHRRNRFSKPPDSLHHHCGFSTTSPVADFSRPTDTLHHHRVRFEPYKRPCASRYSIFPFTSRAVPCKRPCASRYSILPLTLQAEP